MGSLNTRPSGDDRGPIVSTCTLANQANREHRAAEQSAQKAIGHAIECGRLLAEAKAQITHGEFGQWLTDHFEGSERTARAYMRLAREVPLLDDAKRQRVAEMPIRQAIKVLAEPPSATPSSHDDGSSWLPQEPDVTAILDVTGPNETSAQIFVQMAPDDAPHYEAVMITRFKIGPDPISDDDPDNEHKWIRYTTKAVLHWAVAYNVMQFAAGRTAENGKTCLFLEMRRFDQADITRMHKMLCGLGWRQEKTFPRYLFSVLVPQT